MPVSKSEHECTPLVCRLRMNNRDQDACNIFLQDYRCVVTIIRQEDVELGEHDICSSSPYGSNSHMPRKKESSAHSKSKPQSLAPAGAIGQADDRAKADKEAQRLERDQAKLKAIQHASTDSAKASIGRRDAAPNTSNTPKTAQKADEPESSIEAPPLEPGDTPCSRREGNC